MRESEGKREKLEKEREELKASRPKSFINEKKVPFIVFAWALNTAQSQAKYQNNQKQ